MMHAPVGRQQAPSRLMGQRTVAQVVPMPWKMLGAGQLAGVVMLQEPSGLQQAPRQTMVAQEVPLPMKMPPCASHSLAVLMTQVPSGRQQAPSSEMGQAMGPPQLVPMPRKVLGGGHWLGTVMKQVPSGRQQAPRQMMVAQLVPKPMKTPP